MLCSDYVLHCHTVSIWLPRSQTNWTGTLVTPVYTTRHIVTIRTRTCLDLYSPVSFSMSALSHVFLEGAQRRASVCDITACSPSSFHNYNNRKTFSVFYDLSPLASYPVFISLPTFIRKRNRAWWHWGSKSSTSATRNGVAPIRLQNSPCDSICLQQQIGTAPRSMYSPISLGINVDEGI